MKPFVPHPLRKNTMVHVSKKRRQPGPLLVLCAAMVLGAVVVVVEGWQSSAGAQSKSSSVPWSRYRTAIGLKAAATPYLELTGQLCTSADPSLRSRIRVAFKGTSQFELDQDVAGYPDGQLRWRVSASSGRIGLPMPPGELKEAKPEAFRRLHTTWARFLISYLLSTPDGCAASPTFRTTSGTPVPGRVAIDLPGDCTGQLHLLFDAPTARLLSVDFPMSMTTPEVEGPGTKEVLRTQIDLSSFKLVSGLSIPFRQRMHNSRLWEEIQWEVAKVEWPSQDGARR